MHEAWTGTKQDPVRGDKVLNSHNTLEKVTKGPSIADSSLTQPYVVVRERRRFFRGVSG